MHLQQSGHLFLSNQSKTSFYTYNHENHSKPSQDHYHPSTSSSQQHLYRPHYTPLEDETVIRELFRQHQQPFSSDHNYHDTVIVAFEHSTRKTNNLQSTMNKSSYTKGKFATATSHVILHNNSLRGKKASKKDRHSKINTAQGLRDRRMRLSFDVEKKFFKLQDMIGFEKANNTIEWLLMKSKHAIQDLLLQQPDKTCSLIGVSKSASSTSECEVIIVDKLKSTSSTSNREKKKPCRGVRNSGYIHHSVAKETRAQARARARKRTTEKRNYKLGCGDAGVSGCNQYPKYTPCFDQVMDQNINRLGSCCPFGENQVQTTDQAEYPGSHFQLKHGLVGDNSPGMPNL